MIGLFCGIECLERAANRRALLTGHYGPRVPKWLFLGTTGSLVPECLVTTPQKNPTIRGSLVGDSEGLRVPSDPEVTRHSGIRVSVTSDGNAIARSLQSWITIKKRQH